MLGKPGMKLQFIPGWLVLSALAFAACGGAEEHGIILKNYRQDCSKDDDCTTVAIGDLCNCICDSAAIAKADLPEYTADVAKIKTDCLDDMLKCKECPQLGDAVCKAGKCEAAEGGVAGE